MKMTNETPRYYAAYGSNLNTEQMEARCPGARIVGISEIPNFALLFRGSKSGSYLTIEPEDGGVTPVAVWEVTEKHEQALDRYEGYPVFYYKAVVADLPVTNIVTGKIATLDAFIYIMHRDRPLGAPSNLYMKTCERGYDDFGFDPAYLHEAVARSIERAGA